MTHASRFQSKAPDSAKSPATAFLAAIADVHAAVASIGQLVGQGLMGLAIVLMPDGA